MSSSLQLFTKTGNVLEPETDQCPKASSIKKKGSMMFCCINMVHYMSSKLSLHLFSMHLEGLPVIWSEWRQKLLVISMSRSNTWRSEVVATVIRVTAILWATNSKYFNRCVDLQTYWDGKPVSYVFKFISKLHSCGYKTAASLFMFV